MSQVYIKDNTLQPAALMSRELAAKCLISVPALKKPSNKAGDSSSDQYPYDYYTAPVSVQYPDNSTSRTVFIPEVVIYNLPRTAGTSTRYPLGFSRAFIAYFEAALKKGYSGASFNDNRYADTAKYVWTEATVYPADPAKNATGLEVEVSMVKNGKRSKFAYKGLDDFFGKVPIVAARVDMTATIKMQAAVTKGSPLSADAPAKPVFTPTKIFIRGKMDIPQPVGNSIQNAVSSEANNADEDLWKMIGELDATGDDEDEDGSGGEKKATNGKNADPVDDDEDDEFEDES
jgi:hypothetical protein